MNQIPIILDGDPGHDDAIAWVMAFARPELDIRAVISVSGNVAIHKTTKNMLQIMTLLGVHDVPLARGATRPLIGPFFDSPSVHGESGLDGPKMPDHEVELQPLSGVELMAKVLRESNEKITIVPTGPLTDVAMLLLAYPELKEKILRISMMGGGMLYGNWTPAAEYNILCDPEAAKLVFESGIPITMAGLDVTERAYVTPKDFERVRAVGNKVGQIVADWLEFFYQFHLKLGYPGAPVHDPVAIVALVNPEILTTKDVFVQVETGGEFSRGATIGDFYNKTKRPPNVRAIMDIDREAYIDMIVDAVSHYRGGRDNG